MSNPYGPSQSPQRGVSQVPNGYYPAESQGGASYEAPSGHQQPSSPIGMGYVQGQPSVTPPGQPGYYGVPTPMPQVLPTSGPSYGAGVGVAPRKSSHAGMIIGIVAAILVIVLMVAFAFIATSNRPRTSGQAPATSTPTTGASADSTSGSSSGTSSGSSSGTSSGSGHGSSKPRNKNGNEPLSADEESNVVSQCKASLARVVASGNITEWTMQRDGATDKGNLQYLMKGTFEGKLNSGKSGTFGFTCNAVQDLNNGQYIATATVDTK